MACLKTIQQRRLEVQTLYNAGITNAKDISWRIHREDCFRVLELIKNNKSLTHKKGAGAPRKIPAYDEKRISNLLKKTTEKPVGIECKEKYSASTSYKAKLRKNPGD